MLNLNRYKSPDELATELAQGIHGDLDTILTVLREFRIRADTNERDFIFVLRAFELSNLWRQTDRSGTFERFLDNTECCKASRYSTGLRALNEIPNDKLKIVGMAFGKAVIQIEDLENRELAMKDGLATAEKHGVPVSAQTSNNIVRPYLHRTRRDTKEQEEVHALRKENAALRDRLDYVQRELEQAKQEISALRAENERLGGSARATKGNQAVMASRKSRKEDRSQRHA
jgi:dynactin complex subunit